MPSVVFTFRSHDPDGSPRGTGQKLVESLQVDPHLAALADSVYKTISQEPGAARLVLSVEEEPPVDVDYAAVTDELAIADLTRGKTRAVVILLSAAHPRLVAPDLDKLRGKLLRTYFQCDFHPVFDWVMRTKPPLATAVYLNEKEPDTGIDTAAVCIGGAYFRLKSRL